MPFVRASLLFQSVLLGLLVTITGCNEAPLLGAPDAAAGCTAPQLEAPCTVQDAGAPGCSADLQSQAVLGQEVTIAPGSYEAGCTVIVNARSTDQDDQCITLGSCNCQAQDGGTFAWACFQSH